MEVVKRKHSAIVADRTRLSTMSKSASVSAFPGQNMSQQRLSKMRQMSYGFGSVAGIRPPERQSTAGLEYRRPVLTYLNTYQLDPIKRFDVKEVYFLLEDLAKAKFSDHKYNAETSPSLALQLAHRVVTDMRTLQYNRYRIICVVTIGQKRSQSWQNAVMMLWDSDRDQYVDFQTETNSCYCQITVFGIYLD